MHNPMYYRGDIIAVKNIKFKDSDNLDTRLNGHPVIVLNEVNNSKDSIYILKMSGSYDTVDGLEKYYILRPNGDNKLRKASYVDLRYVYKISYENIPCYDKFISPQQYNEILEKLEKTQSDEEEYDETYLEFKNTYLSKKN